MGNCSEFTKIQINSSKCMKGKFTALSSCHRNGRSVLSQKLLNLTCSFLFYFHGVGGMVGRGGSAQLSSSEMSGLVAEVGSVLFQVLGSNPKLLRLVLASRHCVAGIECSAQGPYTCMHRGSDWVSRDLVEPQDPKCCVPCKLN